MSNKDIYKLKSEHLTQPNNETKHLVVAMQGNDTSAKKEKTLVFIHESLPSMSKRLANTERVIRESTCLFVCICVGVTSESCRQK